MDLNFSDFFNYGDTTPINRIAYTQDDIDYKIQYIKTLLAMNENIKITIDKVGNICATLPGDNLVSSNSFIIGSHTDSVRNGGQYDGSLGVYMAMNAMNEIIKMQDQPVVPGKEHFHLFAPLKFVIFACEESTRTGKACIGSSYIASPETVTDENGNEISYYDQLCALPDCLNATDKEKNLGNLGNVLNHFHTRMKQSLENSGLKQKDLNRISYVEKVITSKEIGQVHEIHIQQNEEMLKDQILESPEYRSIPDITKFTLAPEPGTIDFDSLPSMIGAVTTIGKPVRATIKVHSPKRVNPIVAAAAFILNNRKLAYINDDDSIRTSIPQFQSVDTDNQYEEFTQPYYMITCHGESNHSGGTPMNERYDSNVGMSKLIELLDNKQRTVPKVYRFDFLKVETPKYGMNQIQDKTVLYVNANGYDPSLYQLIKQSFKPIQNEYGVTFEIACEESPILVPKSNHVVELTDDIRQCGSTTAENTLQLFDKHVIDKTHQKLGISREDYPNLFETTITSKGDPVQTSKELIDDIVHLCKKMNIKCKKVSSPAGHDTAVVIPPKKNENDHIGHRCMMFIGSLYGSHNPMEQTWRDAIDTGTEVYKNMIVYRLKQIQRQAYHFMVTSQLDDNYQFGSSDSKTYPNRLYDGKGLPELNKTEKAEILDQLCDEQSL